MVFDNWSIDHVASILDGTREGAGWRCRCPVHGGRSLSLRVGHTRKLLAYCFAGCNFPEIAAALRDLDLSDASGATSSTKPHVDRDQRIEQAKRLYARAEPAAGTPVEQYLHSRGITMPVPKSVGYARFFPHRDGYSYPAMVAAIVDVAGEQIGTHATFLVDFADKAMRRECRGSLHGGAVRLADLSTVSLSVNAPQLIVAEGIETALACMEMFDIPAWAALSTSGLMALELPPEIKNVIVAADNDTSGAGHHAATVAYYRWVAEGRRVEIIMPPTPGTDFNDVLIEQGGRDG